MNKPRLLGALCVCVVTTHFSTANAITTTYTDQASFLAALPGPASKLDFESTAAGTTIANGGTTGGITFNYNFGGVSMVVTDGNQFGGGGPFATTSGTNFLGTTDADILQDGDDFTLSVSPVNAIGMFFITADTMLDDDITLGAAGTSVGLNTLDAGTDLGDGGIPYFLGIIDDMNTFTTASITTIGGGFFLYNVDDITTAVIPLPGALWLFGSGLVGLLAFRRRS